MSVRHGGVAAEPLTLGVEEEYLLLDEVTGRPSPVAEVVSEAAVRRPALDPEDVQHELLQVQVEAVTPVCRELDEIGGHLLRLRLELGSAAEANGARLVATGAAPWFDGVVPVTDEARYRDLRSRAPALVDEQLISGMHVHVGVPDRAHGVEVVNRLRQDLPVLLALSTNSPFWRGRDSGFASWRSVHARRWPVGGPPPHFADETDYDRRVENLLATGVLRDRAQLYWEARVSERFPTVEVRCADVQLRVDETVMLAGLVRALVTVALWEMADGVDSPAYEPELIRAAVWAAARNGVDGDLYDLGQGRRRRAGDVLCDLLDRTEPALALADDSAQVHKLLDRLLGEGTGSSRQRAFVRANGLPRLIEMLAAETASAWS